MELPKQDPDQLLRAIRNDIATKESGKLKIFFGYAAGVGKTYTMLQAAHQAKERGIDVVAGYIEPHARPQTASTTAYIQWVSGEVRFYPDKRILRHNPLSTYH